MLETKFGVLNHNVVDNDEKLSKFKDEFDNALPEELRWIKLYDNPVSGNKELQLFIVFNDKSNWRKTFGQSVTKRYILDEEFVGQADTFVQTFESLKAQSNKELRLNVLEETQKDGKAELKLDVLETPRGKTGTKLA